MKFKKISILLVLTMILSSFAFTTFADSAAEDADISVDISSFSNSINKDDSTYKSTCNPEYIYDAVADDTIISFKDNTFYSGRSAGNEPRIHLNGKSTNVANTSLGGLDWTKYKYLRMSFNIYIGDSDDGFAFRTRRRDANNAEVASDMYIAVGGSDLNTSSVKTNPTVFSNKTLTAKKWHNVVMELGSTETSVKFFIDGIETDAGDFTADTHGFVGNANRCVLVAMSNVTTASEARSLDIRLHNFKMTATNTAYTLPTNAAELNQLVYEMNSEKFIDRTLKNEDAQKMKINFTDNAPHIDGKTVASHKVESFKAASSAGSESGYHTLVTNGFLGDVDYTKYDNLRIQFNIFLNDDSNGVYFRTRRTSDGTTWNNDNYIFNIGGAEFNGGTAGSGTAYTYSYKGLETGRWYNVVMEIGANSSNTDVLFYVDGNVVETTKSAAAQNGMSEEAYGFGGGNSNWAILAMMADSGKQLDLYLSDVKMIACNTKHNPSKVTLPKAKTSDANTAVSNNYNSIYVKEAFNADVIIAEKSDASYTGEDFYMLYNDTSKRARYYEIKKGEFQADNIRLSYVDSSSGDSKIISAVANIYNFTGETVSPFAVLALYKVVDGKPALVGNTVPYAISSSEKTFNLNGYTVAGTLNSGGVMTPVDNYDYAKLFIWDSAENRYPLTTKVETIDAFLAE